MKTKNCQNYYKVRMSVTFIYLISDVSYLHIEKQNDGCPCSREEVKKKKSMLI